MAYANRVPDQGRVTTSVTSLSENLTMGCLRIGERQSARSMSESTLGRATPVSMIDTVSIVIWSFKTSGGIATKRKTKLVLVPISNKRELIVKD